PRRQYRQRPKQRRQQHQQQGDSVDTDVVVCTESAYPLHAFNELHLVGINPVEPEPQRQRNDKTNDHDQIRPRANQSLILFIEKEENSHAKQWPESNDRQNMLSKKIHYGAPHKTYPIKTSTPRIITKA